MSLPAEEQEIADLLARGIAATKSGQNTEAYRIFLRVLRLDKNNIDAWLWLARLTDDPEGRRKCLNIVQNLDPQNLEARFMLKELDPPQPSASTGSQPNPTLEPVVASREILKENLPQPPLHAAPARFVIVPQADRAKNEGGPLPGSQTQSAAAPLPKKLRWILILAGGTLLVLLLGTTILRGFTQKQATKLPELVPLAQEGPDTSNLFVEYILDASGSMAEQFPNGAPKSVAAVELLSSHLKTYRPETNLGLRVYGHRIPYQENLEASCQDIELIAPLQLGYVGTIVNWLAAYQPKGMTPIAGALQQAMADFSPGEKRVNSIVLISDGMETCGGDPCALVDELKTHGLRFTVYVIGLNVDEPTRQQLTCIAQSGGGTYQDANNPQELQNALDQVQQNLLDEASRDEQNEDLFEGQIAYIGPDGNVYMLTGANPQPAQVTFDAGGNSRYRSPRWSPDGRTLLFLGGITSDGNFIPGLDTASLYLYEPGNPQPRLISTDVYSFDFFPNGKEIAFLSKQLSFESDNPAIGFWNLETGNVSSIRPVLPPVTQSLLLVDLSPDGSKILVNHTDATFSSIGTFSFMLDVASNSILRSNDYIDFADWAPDSSQIVFVPRSYGAEFRIVLGPPGDENTRILYSLAQDDYIDSILWSPDGSSILFGNSAGSHQISPDGSSISLLSEGKPAAWSPGAKQLLVYLGGRYRVIDRLSGQNLLEFPGGTENQFMDVTWSKSAVFPRQDQAAEPSPTPDPQTQVRQLASRVVNALKNQDLTTLSGMVHPTQGVRISPYAYVMDYHRVFSPAQVRDLWLDPTVYLWGSYDGRGNPIELTFQAYYAKFLYPVDFANAPQTSLNQTLGKGNTIDNAADYYPGSLVVEYYFPGFDPAYQGMDWRSLRIVFQQMNGQWYLVGLINDQWTI